MRTVTTLTFLLLLAACGAETSPATTVTELRAECLELRTEVLYRKVKPDLEGQPQEFRRSLQPKYEAWRESQRAELAAMNETELYIDRRLSRDELKRLDTPGVTRPGDGITSRGPGSD